MSTTLRIGTSGWSYPRGRGAWTGVFYPPAGAPRGRRLDELAYYAERFDTVEVNSTFYRLPAPSVTAGWARRTPSHFEFAVKLFQKFTHPAMFADAHAAADLSLGQGDVETFRRVLDPLATAGKLGPVLAQFPPSFRASPEASDYLRWLLSALRDYRVGVELRHRSWSDAAAETTGLLQEFDAAWVHIDEPKFRSSIVQGAPPGGSSFAYLRLHGRNADAWWQHDAVADRYDYLYAAEELEPFAQIAREARRLARKLYLYMNNHFEAKAVANAIMLKAQLGLDNPGRHQKGLVSRFPALRELVDVEPDTPARLI